MVRLTATAAECSDVGVKAKQYFSVVGITTGSYVIIPTSDTQCAGMSSLRENCWAWHMGTLIAPTHKRKRSNTHPQNKMATCYYVPRRPEAEASLL